MNIKIYFANDDEETEYLTVSNGLKPNVVVQADNRYYRLYVFTIDRLNISFEHAMKQEESCYAVSSGVLIVKEASKKSTINAIQNLPSNYFDNLKPKSIEELDSILADFRKPFSKKFSEWVQVYSQIED